MMVFWEVKHVRFHVFQMGDGEQLLFQGKELCQRDKRVPPLPKVSCETQNTAHFVLQRDRASSMPEQGNRVR